ncbi:P pilus assembly/Cpx signaling pathway, periplasmic inhibitor/zinc-resistance associated protein [Nostocaceae cyanobacterium CENA357]|uniref:P pilus assembly/Cpx signaling pathway, periplasmic inhibitor/zinc-resistance associated protein n=1 Tax=Atlanticothrix silvestris CENA357 TaxID=1725252 RepID=A0A8J7HGA6_9CYAN|nr:P pilus assembly/Cpx signaling pathway, periplasmic inhibitor/zinc-resistance associated protein [Atlanticothrix silvestris]MBH8555113.1 P pilus assembly/Cpx signaling pathway, periplasmic inhibitor/zinc-resistance associated protein [Atlanticothrix silvestris CENA357]
MKLKSLSLIAGAIALTLTAIPFTVKAQTGSSSPLIVAQTPKKERGFWQSLELTDTQKAQMQSIRNDTRAKMEAILTPEQKAKLAAAKAQRQAGQGQRSRKGWGELNLTEAQKTQMRQIKESSKQQMQAILTPEQQAKLKELQENMRQRRQQRQQTR